MQVKFFNPRGTNSVGSGVPSLIGKFMDTIDTFVCFAALMVILNIILQMGSETAAAVWERTVASLDELDFLEGNSVPMTSSGEALLITLAALLKQLAVLPLTLYRAVDARVWRLSREARLSRLRLSLKSDILLAVHSMITGYPERAALMYLSALRERLNAAESSPRGSGQLAT